MRAWAGNVPTLVPGLAVCATIAMAATFVSDHHGGPTLLYALLIGIGFHFLSQNPVAAPGIQLTSRTILRLAVALLGVRISTGDMMALGFVPVGIVVSSVLATIAFGRLLARPLGLTKLQGILTGGAVAICGASAALAISAVLPRTETAERDTLFTVVAVTVMSTLAMILYPVLIQAMDVDHRVAGIIIGGTIHDVAQVVGAGYLISPATGVVATYVKLMRVAMLMPVVVGLTWSFRHSDPDSQAPAQPILPAFLVGFLALAIANSLGLVPVAIADAMGQISRWCLVAAIAALGMKTSMQEFAALGWRPLALVIGSTLFLLAMVLAELKIGMFF